MSHNLKKPDVRVLLDKDGYLICAGDFQHFDDVEEVAKCLQNGGSVKTVPYEEYLKIEWAYFKHTTPKCSKEVKQLLLENGFDPHGLSGEIEQDLARKWIRVKFGIYIYVSCKEKEDGSNEVWYIPCGRHLPFKKSGGFVVDIIPYSPKNSPEEATDAALLFVLKNLIHEK